MMNTLLLLFASLPLVFGRLGGQSEGGEESGVLQMQERTLNETYGEAVNEVGIIRVCFSVPCVQSLLTHIDSSVLLFIDSALLFR
jgi:hypothetical protein